MVINSDKHWAHSLRAKPQWKVFRTTGCPKYVQPCTIFGASVAIGTLRHASMHPLPTSDDERQLDEDLRRRINVGNRNGVGMDSADMNSLMGVGQSSFSLGQNKHRRNKGGTTQL